ncbi:YnjH family protein [Vibrio gigantis]|uniref:YnjH family protein n=1 Tax=Vibrio gigantis TaxID=296199 RepID=UPI001BFCF6DD|nr:YnjH family protein [Vibrio gigantis]
MVGKSMIRVNLQIVKVFLIAASMFCSMSASANKVISTPGKTAVVVTQGGQPQRVCYYDDKAYSIGAVLEVGGVVIQCAAENDFEQNGSLAWIQIKKDE